MAVRALHPMNVVGALRVQECGIHLLHIDAAVREARMAVGAGLPGHLAVLLMAGKTAQAFVDADGRAIVTAANLHVG